MTVQQLSGKAKSGHGAERTNAISRISNRQLVITFLACRLSAEMMTLSAETVLYGPDRFTAILLSKIIAALLYIPLILVTLRFKGDSTITCAFRRNSSFGAAVGVILAVTLTAAAIDGHKHRALYNRYAAQ